MIKNSLQLLFSYLYSELFIKVYCCNFTGFILNTHSFKVVLSVYRVNINININQKEKRGNVKVKIY